ncbi:hypothetical protein CEXT_432631 [Caerostris extrusa]|uniref:Uncharacterized protein n=1 Tax=Caerostris extrusa TaxID=172846 RepID=A0AAV4SQK3_CAEEX|nr:hypothetical protein CEXT_432631 [Caerostris extrusa]
MLFVSLPPVTENSGKSNECWIKWECMAYHCEVDGSYTENWCRGKEMTYLDYVVSIFDFGEKSIRRCCQKRDQPNDGDVPESRIFSLFDLGFRRLVQRHRRSTARS